MSCAVLSIGTELTRGELINSNAAWLSDALTYAGFEVTEHAVVDDDKGRIISALTRLAGASEVIVCTGGLGPTGLVTSVVPPPAVTFENVSVTGVAPVVSSVGVAMTPAPAGVFGVNTKPRETPLSWPVPTTTPASLIRCGTSADHPDAAGRSVSSSVVWAPVRRKACLSPPGVNATMTT